MGKSRNELKKSMSFFNPRASTGWSNDNSKYGQRMLEKMGWKKGQGLGIRCQGTTENIKLRLKFDSKGLGFKMKDDQWLQKERDFSGVLFRLKRDNDIIPRNRVLDTKESLESKSVISKSRVHYFKFTRGKDVSQYNNKDLAGILGRNLECSIEENTEPKCNVHFVSSNIDLANGVLHYEKHDSSNVCATKSVPASTEMEISQIEEHPSNYFCKKSTKSERIIEKNRLLRKLQQEDLSHKFAGSNLTNISGYGNCGI